jgi:hypothetical protein
LQPPRQVSAGVSSTSQVLPAAHLPGPQSQFAARPRRRRSGS